MRWAGLGGSEKCMQNYSWNSFREGTTSETLRRWNDNIKIVRLLGCDALDSTDPHGSGGSINGGLFLDHSSVYNLLRGCYENHHELNCQIELYLIC
jgi:hypothetical protein